MKSVRELKTKNKKTNYTFKIVTLLCKISRSKTSFLVKYRILMQCFFAKYVLATIHRTTNNDIILQNATTTLQKTHENAIHNTRKTPFSAKKA